MCGIAGWFDRELDLRSQDRIIGEMSDSMYSRGPDEGGLFLDRDIAMIHRRLAVIDIEKGSQPMIRKRGEETYVIVYNGEIYNSPELREELGSLGYSFLSDCDTETVLLSYIHWGEDCIQKLSGIFAFAVYECKSKKIFLARDRAGVKPLFYYRYKEGIIFSSQIQTLLRNPLIPHHITEEGLYELLFLGPGRTPGSGIVKDISELRPGEYAVYSEGRLKKKAYFSLKAREFEYDSKKTITLIREVVTDSITRQLVSDVPLFCFLSGGLDSSIISLVASEHFRARGEKLATYSVDYRNNDIYFRKNEFQPTPDSEFIGIMTEHIYSEHSNIVLDNYELFTALTSACEARGLPGMTDVDSSLLLFCREIKKRHTVGLSGECADELFAGYPWYHKPEILERASFPWSPTLDIRRSLLKKGILTGGEDYVREKYLDTCRHTDRLSSDTPLEARRREMFALNYYWFMQTLLEVKDIKEKYSFFVAALLL